MASIPHDCPHCGTKNAAFNVLHEYHPTPAPHEIDAFAACAVCHRGCVVVFMAKGRSVDPEALRLGDHYGRYRDEFVELAFFPAPSTPDAPEHLPDNVRQFFLEGAANVRTGPNAAGAMFRKSIDVGLRHIDPAGKGNLVARIDKAADNGLITPDLKDWAHHVRLQGNDAAHDDDPFTPDEAEALHRFTELLLLYLFTLPGMVRALQVQVKAVEE